MISICPHCFTAKTFVHRLGECFPQGAFPWFQVMDRKALDYRKEFDCLCSVYKHTTYARGRAHILIVSQWFRITLGSFSRYTCSNEMPSSELMREFNSVSYPRQHKVKYQRGNGYKNLFWCVSWKNLSGPNMLLTFLYFQLPRVMAHSKAKQFWKLKTYFINSSNTGRTQQSFLVM